MPKEAFAPVHVHELPPLPEKKKLPEAANDNVEIPNDNEKIEKLDTIVPPLADDNNEAADKLQIAELKERLGLTHTPENTESAVEVTEALEELPAITHEELTTAIEEVPQLKPEELNVSVKESGIEAGHASPEKEPRNEAQPVQAAGGASRSEGGTSGGSGGGSSESTAEKSSGGGGKGLVSKFGKFLKGVIKFPLFVLGAVTALALKLLISATNFSLHTVGKLPKKGESKPSSAAKPKSGGGGGHGGGAAHH